MRNEKGTSDSRHAAGDGKNQGLEYYRVITHEPNPVFVVPHRNQQSSQSRGHHQLEHQVDYRQHSHSDEIEGQLGLLAEHRKAEYSAVIGNAVGAAGIGLLSHEEDTNDESQSLGDKGEINSRYSAPEHQITQTSRQQSRDYKHHRHGKPGIFEGSPKQR